MLADSDVEIISRLHFVANKRHHAGRWGERRSTRRGEGTEFADYRDYTPGDDIRAMDWNLYARLDRPYVRLFEEEEDLLTAVFLDDSISMGWDIPTVSRWSVTQQLASALGAIGLYNGDVLYGSVLQLASTSTWGPTRGGGYFPMWQQWVHALRPEAQTTLSHNLEVFAVRTKRPALVLILTDGYDVEGLVRGTTALASHGHDIVLLHILTSSEIKPSLHGEYRLHDVETGEKREVTIDAHTHLIYQQKFNLWCQQLHQIVSRHRGRYVLVEADLPLRQLMLKNLRQANVVR